VDQPAQERNIGAGPDGRMQISHGTGAGKTWIDVDELGAIGFRLHGPTERDRMALGHVGAFDDDAVGKLEVAWIHGRGTAP
jgi:hypothetical protein